MHSQVSKAPKVCSHGWTALTAPYWSVAWLAVGWDGTSTDSSMQANINSWITSEHWQIKHLYVTKAIHPLFPQVLPLSSGDGSKATALQGWGHNDADSINGKEEVGSGRMMEPRGLSSPSSEKDECSPVGTSPLPPAKCWGWPWHLPCMHRMWPHVGTPGSLGWQKHLRGSTVMHWGTQTCTIENYATAAVTMRCCPQAQAAEDSANAAGVITAQRHKESNTNLAIKWQRGLGHQLEVQLQEQRDKK